MQDHHRVWGGRFFVAVVLGLGAACTGDPTLSTTEQAAVYATPSSVDFQSVALGSTAQVMVEIKPATLSGSDDDTIYEISESCPGFGVSAPHLPARVYCGGSVGTDPVPTTATGKSYGAGGVCDPTTYWFSTTFTPQVAGTQSCNLFVKYGPTGQGAGAATSLTIVLTGTGAAAAHAMAVMPQTLSFGDIPVSTTSETQTIQINNVGSAPIEVRLTPPPGPFTANGPTSTMLQPGGASSYTVSCTPTMGTHSGSLVFTLFETQTVQTVSLSCNGITSSVGVSPRPITMPSMLVGDASVSSQISITNTGDTTVTIDSIDLDPASSSELAIINRPANETELPSGGDTPLIVTLEYSGATAHASGPLGALQLVVDGVPQSIAISGEAVIAALDTNPATVDFGPICVGRPASRRVAVFASDRGRVQITSVTPPGAIFTATDLVAQLEPLRGNEETIEVTATPESPGEYADQLVINSNVPGRPAYEVPVTAIALPPGITPTPSLVAFGVAEVGTTTIAQKVAVTNCSDAPIDIAGATIRADSPGEFAAVSDPVATLAPAESHEILIVMTPAANGARSAELTIDIAGGSPLVVPLEGEGFGFDPIERETYYACASTRPGALWPVLLVIGLVCRRRRRT